ncbi:AraC family transcriptional regulator [Acetobacterium paludosum]|uniref:AraC family transcriptional regulator n=1 Tax=Acetobacterium paludosum TaxID=52693 RepID=A0A923HZM0_9FIRM|nr:GyrI-like domain-containing protein [Acetobacterium paludosum]MBC3889539.1 AraC family transcriptional regulator [Acetobacterium paludosum]
MFKNELVSKAIDYIVENLNEEISIEDVAAYCHLSKYYFCRVFKSETGESIYGFIKRLKMEQSAIEMKLIKNKSITDIGVTYGYSSSNYSSAFKKHHHVSPAAFRKNVNMNSAPHPFILEKKATFQSFDEYNQQIQIKDLDNFKVIYERYLGNYLDLGKNWSEFTEKNQNYFREETLLIERFFDDPSITNVGQCLYDICMTVDTTSPLENVMTIQGGKFAVYSFDGLIPDIFEAFQGVFNIWMPNSGYEMDERYGLNIYRKIDRDEQHVVMDLCIPVK